jgi:hypothetical protein
MKSTHLNIAIILIILFNLFGIGVPVPSGSIMDEELDTEAGDRSLLTAQNADHHLFLPILISPPRHTPRINLPYFEDNIRYPETAIFWFSRVTPTENYTDVRLGYNDQELFVHLTVFDRRLWNEPSPTVDTLTQWDAATLYFNLAGSQGDAPSTSSYRLIAQLNWWEPRADWQAAYHGNGRGWAISDIPFTSTNGWRGTTPNNDSDDRGWTMAFRIPFASLGLSAAPQEGSVWGLSLTLHDSDDSA